MEWLSRPPTFAEVEPQFWLTAGALAVAAVALLLNFFQFKESLRQLRARARFRVTLRHVRADSDGVLRTSGNKAALRVEVGIKNEGDKAAGETLINVVVPRPQEHVRWSGPNGEELLDVSSVTAETDERLPRGDGREYEAKYLSRMLPRVGLKPYHVVYFQFYADVPDQGEVQLPVRVTVQADEIPDDIEEYSERLLVRAVRDRPG